MVGRDILQRLPNWRRIVILYDLKCANDHTFEAWFRDGESYDDQVAAGEITCPLCGDGEVCKAPMAPRVQSKSVEGETLARAAKALRGLHDHVEKNFDNVGDRFPEEARKIHYGEVEKRNIYGRASIEEARCLNDEGIEFGTLPKVPQLDS